MAVTIYLGKEANRTRLTLELKARKSLEAEIPLGRYVKSEEVGQLALFLASDESAFITGATYVVDGGSSM